jgi:hypothetical protein
MWRNNDKLQENKVYFAHIMTDGSSSNTQRTTPGAFTSLHAVDRATARPKAVGKEIGGKVDLQKEIEKTRTQLEKLEELVRRQGGAISKPSIPEVLDSSTLPIAPLQENSPVSISQETIKRNEVSKNMLRSPLVASSRLKPVGFTPSVAVEKAEIQEAVTPMKEGMPSEHAKEMEKLLKQHDEIFSGNQLTYVALYTAKDLKATDADAKAFQETIRKNFKNNNLKSDVQELLERKIKDKEIDHKTLLRIEKPVEMKKEEVTRSEPIGSQSEIPKEIEQVPENMRTEPVALRESSGTEKQEERKKKIESVGTLLETLAHMYEPTEWWKRLAPAIMVIATAITPAQADVIGTSEIKENWGAAATDSAKVSEETRKMIEDLQNKSVDDIVRSMITFDPTTSFLHDFLNLEARKIIFEKKPIDGLSAEQRRQASFLIKDCADAINGTLGGESSFAKKSSLDSVPAGVSVSQLIDMAKRAAVTQRK